MSITLHKGDLPDGVTFSGSVAVDTETLGLKTLRDKLCLVQLSDGDGTAHIVQLDRENYEAPNLKKLLGDRNVVKIFHYARFDVAVIAHYLRIHCAPLWCTKIGSKLARTYTDRHGLRDVCRELLNVELNKQQQTSDWGAEELSEDQLKYAANDVYHLHDLKNKLDALLTREGRTELAQKCFDFLPTRAFMDLESWPDDLFEH